MSTNNGTSSGLDPLDSEGVETMTEVNFALEPRVSLEALASLGEGHIAYVKQIRSEDVPDLFPQAPKIAPGLKLFALHAADGTPIMLTDSREAAVANAWSNELQAVSVFVVASMAWTLDCMDQQFFALARPDAMNELVSSSDASQHAAEVARWGGNA